MAAFPKLKTGATIQYPAVRRTGFATRLVSFLDGSAQAFRWGGAALRRWEIRLDLLDESEMAAIEQFFVDNEGRFGSFAFTDPWDGTEYPDCSLGDDSLELRANGELRGATALTIRENRS
jgi:hypothetical protein